MKIIILILLAATVYTNYSDIEKSALFKKWQLTYHRRYPSEEIQQFRFQIFSENLRQIDIYNSEISSAVFELNQFADLSSDEFSTIYLQQISPYKLQNTQYSGFELPTDIPNDWDWSTRGVKTQIRSQGQCKAGWAFSTTANLESQYIIRDGLPITLSAQQLIDCDFNNKGCSGDSTMNEAFKWLLENKGIMTERDYPYRGMYLDCMFDAQKAVIQVQSYNTTDFTKNEDQMAALLQTHGPLSIGMHSTILQLYKGGIITPLYCKNEMNHGALVVGYGRDEGKDFWKIKNSWGSSWGEKGYFRIIRGKNTCGVASVVTQASIQ